MWLKHDWLANRARFVLQVAEKRNCGTAITTTSGQNNACQSSFDTLRFASVSDCFRYFSGPSDQGKYGKYNEPVFL